MLSRSPASSATLPAPTLDPASGITLSLRTPFHEPPCDGALPVALTLRNESRHGGRWDLVFVSGTPYLEERESHHSVAVEAGAARTFHLTVPLSEGAGWTNVRMRMRGPGVLPGEVALYHRSLAQRGPGNHVDPSASFALSESLATAHAPDIDAELAAENVVGAGSRFLPAELPQDAGAYAGFRLLILEAGEWDGLPAETRRAALGWVALGGRLIVAGRDAPARPHGLGRVVFLPAPAEGGRLAREILEVAPPTAFAARFGLAPAAGTWTLPTRLPEPPPARGRLLLFITIVAGVMGPLNLFVLARGTRRHRVYWTTPLLSLAACLVLGGLIVVQDGIGGRGLRATAIAVLPGENLAAVVQEQVARTGLVVSDRWTSPERLRIANVPPLGGTDWHRSARRIVQAAGLHAGFFRSRSREAHYLEAIRPTRAKVQVRRRERNGPPEAVSSFAAAFTSLYFVDESGRAWAATQVVPGVRTPLAPSRDLETWWRQGTQHFSPTLRVRLEGLAAQPGYFYGATAASGALETLGAVEWTQEALLWLGPAEILP